VQIKVDERNANALLEEAEDQADSWTNRTPSVADFEAKAKG
jgi:hypothetical protein